jgi:ABC-type tungstate transport system substrate-binding protein
MKSSRLLVLLVGGVIGYAIARRRYRVKRLVVKVGFDLDKKSMDTVLTEMLMSADGRHKIGEAVLGYQ